VLHDSSNGAEMHKPKQYTVFNSIIPQFFWSQFQGSVEQIQLVLEGTREHMMDTNSVTVSADRAKMVYWYKGEGQVVLTGSLQASFVQDKPNAEPKMESLLFDIRHHEHFLPRSRVIELCNAAAASGQTKSPKLTKNAGTKKGQGKQQQPASPPAALVPESPAGEFGFSPATQLWLEVSRSSPLEVFCAVTNSFRCAKPLASCKTSWHIHESTKNYR
jgi:hypothetical protein